MEKYSLLNLEAKIMNLQKNTKQKYSFRFSYAVLVEGREDAKTP